MDMNNYHTSVLLQEVIDFLDVVSGENYIDATLGGGGHAMAIVERGGNLLGIDADTDALEEARRKYSEVSAIKNNGTFISVQGNFENIVSLSTANHFQNVSGILFDLGVSSHQLDVATRGFSFKEGPLDMRMDSSLSVKAADLVNGLTRGELAELFERYGEEKFAKRIANAIAAKRVAEPFTTTTQLVHLISASVPFIEGQIHPATRVFQALRIAVNDEMNVLRRALPDAFSLIQSGGRLVVISFHSLEDRIVKHTFEKLALEGKGEVLTKKPITPSEQEILLNKRSRSSKLRVIQKI